MTDEELYLAYRKKGDESALRELLIRHRTGLTLFIFGFTRNMEDAEELMLDAFAQAAAEGARFDPKRKFKTWLFAIGRNLAISHYRRKLPDTIPLEQTQEAEHAVEPAYFKEERYRSLYEELNGLKPEYRQVLFLQYLEEMDTEEIMRIMKKNRKQIYNLSFQAKKALKDALERRGIDHEEYR